VECANHAALKDRPEAFDGLSMDGADDILASRMVNGGVREVFIEALVSGPLIGAKQADLVGDSFSHKCVERGSLDVRDHAGHDVTLAADRADDRRFAGTNAARSAAAAFIPMPVLCQAADESFIDLDNAAEFINVLHKGRSNLMAHEPSGFIGTEAHVTIKLQSAHAFLANEHKVNDAIPIAKRLVGVLENSSGDVGKTVGNTVSAVHALPLECHGFKPIDMPASATRTMNAFWPLKEGSYVHSSSSLARASRRESFRQASGRCLAGHTGGNIRPFAQPFQRHPTIASLEQAEA
jgi:hypothetical protein